MFNNAPLCPAGRLLELTEETLAQCKRFDVEIFSDLFKDANGFRPRFGLGDRTPAQLDALWDRTIREAEEAAVCEAEREHRAVARWDQFVDSVIETGAGNYETAVRWIVGDDDLDYVLWSHGVTAFHNTNRIKELAGL